MGQRGRGSRHGQLRRRDDSALVVRDGPPGRTVSEQEVAAINIVQDAFHGEWNYTIRPRSKARHLIPADSLGYRVMRCPLPAGSTRDLRQARTHA